MGQENGNARVGIDDKEPQWIVVTLFLDLFFTSEETFAYLGGVVLIFRRHFPPVSDSQQTVSNVFLLLPKSWVARILVVTLRQERQEEAASMVHINGSTKDFVVGMMMTV